MKGFDLLVKGGLLVDPAHKRQGLFDVGIANGQVVEVETDLYPDQAREVFDARDRLVLPGLVDTHVHISPAPREVGLRMLACAGVTLCLECGGFMDEVLKGIAKEGSGIQVAVLQRLDPGVSISGPDAGREEVTAFLERSLKAGALGLKLLGGHFPLSPSTTVAAIEAANRAGAYIAFHCGTTKNGSNLFGFMDALELAGKNRLHICHVNAYCRGLTHGSPVEETMIALKELAARPHLVSESHMAAYNGCGAVMENDTPRSHITRTCLKAGGFPATREGLLDAARQGHMLVQKDIASRVTYLKPEEAVSYLEEVHFDATVSFPVNRRSTAFLMATEKDPSGQFIIPALSTDGGAIPRNFLLSHGLSLVRFDALTLSEFVTKCSWIPAAMLGLPRKGHLGLGADADLAVVDPRTHECLLTLVGGKTVMTNGIVTGTGGIIVTTPTGQESLADQGVRTCLCDLSRSLLYTAPWKGSKGAY
jgi:hypothetical protein